MAHLTHKDYITGIRAKYEIEKEGVYACYLSKPSPALLLDYCKILKEKELTRRDKAIIDTFLTLSNFDVDKFRPICNFFKGKTENPSQDILDIMALLVDYQPRPLGDFLRGGKNVDLISDNAVKANPIVSSESVLELTPVSKASFIQRNRHYLFVFLFLCFIMLAYTIYFSHKACLEWQNDRFVEVECETEGNRFVGLVSKVPFDEDLLLLRKITPCDTTTYFKNGRAVIWYCKVAEDRIELFNAPGHHPVTNKPLKAITKYMIEKYLR